MVEKFEMCLKDDATAKLKSIKGNVWKDNSIDAYIYEILYNI
jgi:hypothetical protein